MTRRFTAEELARLADLPRPDPEGALYYHGPLPDRRFISHAPEMRESIDALVARVRELEEAIDDYMLWEPGRKGHAQAARKLRAIRGGDA